MAICLHTQATVSQTSTFICDNLEGAFPINHICRLPADSCVLSTAYFLHATCSIDLIVSVAIEM